jgi:hypothetical protein
VHLVGALEDSRLDTLAPRGIAGQFVAVAASEKLDTLLLADLEVAQDLSPTAPSKPVRRSWWSGLPGRPEI